MASIPNSAWLSTKAKIPNELEGYQSLVWIFMDDKDTCVYGTVRRGGSIWLNICSNKLSGDFSSDDEDINSGSNGSRPNPQTRGSRVTWNPYHIPEERPLEPLLHLSPFHPKINIYIRLADYEKKKTTIGDNAQGKSKYDIVLKTSSVKSSPMYKIMFESEWRDHPTLPFRLGDFINENGTDKDEYDEVTGEAYGWPYWSSCCTICVNGLTEAQGKAPELRDVHFSPVISEREMSDVEKAVKEKKDVIITKQTLEKDDDVGIDSSLDDGKFDIQHWWETLGVYPENDTLRKTPGYVLSESI